MKKLLGVVLGLIVLLAVALVVLPGVIEWNDYKDTIQTHLRQATGRDVTIGGDIHIALLPAPALVASGVRMANVEGGSAPEMVRLKSLEIRIALGPLLSGDIQVETVRLVEPVVELERLAEGRANWDFAKARAETDGSTSAPLPGVAGELPGGIDAGAIRLDSFEVENGTIIYRDARSGVVERIEKLDAKLSAESLSGPFESMGSLTFRGIPLGYEVVVGRVINERTVPLNMVVTVQPGDVKVETSGTIVELDDAPKFKGRIIANGKQLSSFIEAIGGQAEPDVLAKPFGAAGDVTISAAALSAKKLAVSLGEIRADGEIDADLSGAPPRLALRLTAPRVDVDALLAAPAPSPAGAATGPAAGTGGTALPDAPSAADRPFALPDGVDASLDLTAEFVIYRGSVISDARLVADLHGGEVVLNQLSAQFPGGSDLFLTGNLAAANGQPKFDGAIDAKASDLRRVLGWLGIEVPGVPSDRLRKATLKGQVMADATQVQGLNLDMVVDSSRVTGGITLALRERLAFGASFTIDRLNLDAYLPAPAQEKSTDAAAGSQTAAAPAAQAGAVPAGFAFLDVLNRFDANLRLAIDRLNYRQAPATGVAFDGTLFNGSLEVRKLAVGDMAGASAQLSGTFNGLNQIPSVANGRIEVKGVDVDRLSRLLEVAVPVATRDVGVIDMSGTVEGSVLGPQVDLAAKTPEGRLDVKGRLSVLPIDSLFAGDVRVAHADFPRLLRLIGLDYWPTGRLGDFALAATVEAGPRKIALSQVDGHVGPTTVAAAVTVDLSGPLPYLSGQMQTGPVDIDALLPADRSAALPGGGTALPGMRAIPAAWAPAGTPPAVPSVQRAAAERWSAKPIDLGFLRTFGADLKLNSEAIVYDGVPVRNVVADVAVKDGVLSVSSLTGTLFDGALKGDATVRSGDKPSLGGSLALTAGDFGAIGQELQGRRTASGTIGFAATVGTTGGSVAELVGGLAGEGSFEVRKVALEADSGSSSALGPISGLLKALNQLAGTLVGTGQRPEGLADVSASFKAENGVVRSEDLLFVSSLGEGRGKGDLDLPKWTMNLQGDMQLSQNLFSQLLSGTTGLELTLPFRIQGDIDQPNVVIDVAKLPGKVLSIPGTVLEKSPLGKALRTLIPGGGN